MCTAISYRGLAGRTLDLEYSFGEEVVITPRNWQRKFVFLGELPTKYAIVGAAYVHLGEPLYYDALSESGLYMAALNFPGYANYRARMGGMINLSSAELIPYILGMAGSLDEAKKMLRSINITPDSIAPDLPITELHWHLTDGRETLVIEPRENGLQITTNPHNVLTNAPNFAYHTTKIAEFSHISPTNPTETEENGDIYSRGMGAIGLPGDYSSSSRFVRAAFLVKNVTEFGSIYPPINKKENESENIFTHINEKIGKNKNISPQKPKNDVNESTEAYFHIADSVCVPYGAVLTDDGRAVYTVYTSCADIKGGVYRLTTYHCRTPRMIALTEEHCSSRKIERFALFSQEK